MNPDTDVFAAAAGLCADVYPGVDIDCICGLEPHDDDTYHECLEVGCEQTWKSRAARRTA